MPSGTIHGKMWFLGLSSEFAQRSTETILHASVVSDHGTWLPYCSCDHTIQTLNVDFSGLDYNGSENSVHHRCPVIPIFGDGELKHKLLLAGGGGGGVGQELLFPWLLPSLWWRNPVPFLWLGHSFYLPSLIRCEVCALFNENKLFR